MFLKLYRSNLKPLMRHKQSKNVIFLRLQAVSISFRYNIERNDSMNDPWEPPNLFVLFDRTSGNKLFEKKVLIQSCGAL